jgi:hypothetical protein
VALVIRPAQVCQALLAALAASEGQRKRRKRDQTPDAIGLAVKRELLERAVEADPEPEIFEAWLLNYSQNSVAAEWTGPASAMARAVFDEWRLAHSLKEFSIWLNQGAPSADVADGNRESSHTNVRETG